MINTARNLAACVSDAQMLSPSFIMLMHAKTVESPGYITKDIYFKKMRKERVDGKKEKREGRKRIREERSELLKSSCLHQLTICVGTGFLHICCPSVPSE